MKKLIIPLFAILLVTSFVAAQSINIEFPNGDQFQPGEKITFKATLYDSNSNPIDGEISLKIEDSKNIITKELTVQSKEINSINFEGASSGQGLITAKNGNAETIEFFEIGEKEIAKFELNKNVLKVTNIGNTKYTKTIKITIGNTIGTKQPNLEIGKSVSYRLVAPEGTYNIKITDGTTSLNRGEVSLSGTGQVVGAIDDSTSKGSALTGVTKTDDESDLSLFSLKGNAFAYVFGIIIFATAILLAIERRYKKKVKS